MSFFSVKMVNLLTNSSIFTHYGTALILIWSFSPSDECKPCFSSDFGLHLPLRSIHCASGLGVEQVVHSGVSKVCFKKQLPAAAENNTMRAVSVNLNSKAKQ